MKQHVNCIKYTAQHDGTIPSASVQQRTERGRETSTHNDPLYEFQRSSVNAVRTGILLRTLMTRRKTTKQMKDTHGWSRQRREWRGCVVVVVTMEHLEVYARHYVNNFFLNGEQRACMPAGRATHSTHKFSVKQLF